MRRRGHVRKTEMSISLLIVLNVGDESEHLKGGYVTANIGNRPRGEKLAMQFFTEYPMRKSWSLIWLQGANELVSGGLGKLCRVLH